MLKMVRNEAAPRLGQRIYWRDGTLGRHVYGVIVSVAHAEPTIDPVTGTMSHVMFDVALDDGRYFSGITHFTSGGVGPRPTNLPDVTCRWVEGFHARVHIVA